MKRFVLPLIMIAAMALLVSCASETYKEASSVLKASTKELKNAKNCEELDKVWDRFYESYYEKYYDDGGFDSKRLKRAVSEKEYEKLDKQEWEIEALLHERMKEMGCE